MAVDTALTEAQLDKLMFGMPQDLKNFLQSILGGTLDIRFPSYTDASRPAFGNAGLVIFNTDDGQLNVDDGSQWTLPDGTAT